MPILIGKKIMIIELNDITKVLDKTSRIKFFSYVFESGNIYLLLGENGSGKTTLLKCMSSLYTFSEGAIVVDKHELKNYKQLVQYRNHISLLINSEGCLIPNLTILQNIKFFLGMNDINYIIVEKQTDELIDKFNLRKHLGKPVCKLSKGMKQKTALIITFLKNRDIILLDEPFDGLDSNGIVTLRELIEKNVKDKIIVITSPSDITLKEAKIVKVNG